MNKGARLQNYFQWTQKMWHAHTWLPSLSRFRVLWKSLVKPKVNFTGNLKPTAEVRKFQQRLRNVRLCPPTRSNEGLNLWRQHGPEDGCPHSVRDNTDQHTLRSRTRTPLGVIGVRLPLLTQRLPEKSQSTEEKLKWVTSATRSGQRGSSSRFYRKHLRRSDTWHVSSI